MSVSYGTSSGRRSSFWRHAEVGAPRFEGTLFFRGFFGDTCCHIRSVHLHSVVVARVLRRLCAVLAQVTDRQCGTVQQSKDFLIGGNSTRSVSFSFRRAPTCREISPRMLRETSGMLRLTELSRGQGSHKDATMTTWSHNL